MRNWNLNVLSNLIIGGVLLLICLWMGYSWYVHQTVHDIRTSWQKQSAMLSQVEQGVHHGYGILANEQFYITLRGYLQTQDPAYLENFGKSIEVLKQFGIAYRQLELTGEELQSLDLLSHSLTVLESIPASIARENVTALQEGEFAKKVDLNNENALRAMSRLALAIDQRMAEAAKGTSKAMDEVTEVVSQGWFWGPVLLILLIAFSAVMRRLNTTILKLQASRRDMDDLLNATPEASIVSNSKGNIIFSNAAAQKLLGYSRDELRSMSIEQLLPSANRAGHPEMREAFMQRSGGVRVGERGNVVALTKNGREIQVNIGLSKLEREGGTLTVASIHDMSPRLAAEKELRLSEERFRTLFQHAPVGAVMLNRDGQLRLANHALQKMLGYNAEEFSAMRFTDFTHPDDIEINSELFNELVEGKRDHFYMHKRYIRKDGDVVWGSLGVSAVRDDSGSITNIIGIIEDITEVKSKEQELMAAEEKYRTFFDMAPEGILIVDPESALPIEFNKIACDQLGYTREEFAQIPIYLHEIEKEPGVRRTRLESLENGHGNFEVQHVTKAGELRNVLVTEQRVMLADRPMLFVAFRDITDVRRLSERFELATRAGEIGVWDWNIVTNVVSWDAVMEDLYSIRGVAQEKIYEAWQARLHPEDRDGVVKRLEKAIKSQEEDYNDEFRIVSPDGEVRYIQTATTILRNSEGRALRVLGINWDITEMKETSIALGKAKQRAEAASLSKSEFLANMSHEIRTPMNAIIGLTQLILGTSLSPVQKDYLTKIQGSSKSLLRILNDILDYSKIEAGRLELESAQFSLDDILEQLSSLFSATLESKGIELNFWIDPEVPRTLVGDGLRLSQVLINLVSNAIKFTEYGEIQLYGEVVAQTDDEVELRFSVVDSGMGIEDEEMDRLFHAFSQADTSTTRRFGGTGLGLAISQNLVEMMGGKIIVESTPGEGSSFSFNCKLGLATESIMREFFHDKGLRVLVVDGAESSRGSIVSMLRSWNIDVAESHAFDDAIKQLLAAPYTDNPFDLMIMECCRDNESCLDSLRSINEKVEAGELKKKPHVILVSSTRTSESSVYENKALYDALLIKPVIPSTLYETLVGICDGAWGKKNTHNVDLAELAQPIKDARILLVEDNKINQQVASELLTQAGLDVYVANNGEEAVVATDNADFDAILMDLQMPVMDGFEATALIRNKQPEIPIIAMTAAAMLQDRERCLDAGMNDHIPKPMDPVHVIKSLLRWIQPGYDHTDSDAPESLGRAPVASGKEGLPLDTELGLAHVAGDEILYQRLLRQFVMQHETSGTELIELLAQGDEQQVATWLHSMKGSSGTIGAAQLFKICRKFNAQIENGKMLSPEQGHEILAALEQVIVAINGYLPKESSGYVLTPMGSDEMLADLAVVKERLNSSELVGYELIEKLVSFSVGLDYSRLFLQLKREVDSYNYDKALELVEEITTILKKERQ